MMSAMKMTVFAPPVARRSDRDLSWYGTFGVLAACLGVLLLLLFAG
jgi:hypothetical protein